MEDHPCIICSLQIDKETHRLRLRGLNILSDADENKTLENYEKDEDAVEEQRQNHADG